MISMRRLLILVVLFAAGFTLVTAQDIRSVGQPNANEIGVDSAQQKLKEISISKFEDAGFLNLLKNVRGKGYIFNKKSG